MHKLLFIIAFLLAAYGVSRAQEFDYSIVKDSVTWTPLSSQTILNTGNSAWNFSYKIPIGFSFPFCGRNFDSLTIETNGYIVFDNNHRYAFTAFSGVGDHIDGTGTHAVLSYAVSGSAGNHILKIQFLNCSPYVDGTEVLSWQVWLNENGDTEVRVGPGTLRTDAVTSIVPDQAYVSWDTIVVNQLDSTQSYRMGILNMNMDTEERGVFAYGSPTVPQTAEVSETEPEVPVLLFVPASGCRYTFKQD